MQAFDLKKNLSLIYLIICGVLTMFAVIFSFYTYVSWSELVPQDPEILQIKLPVMKWAEHSTLSKRYENGIITEESDSAGEDSSPVTEEEAESGPGLAPSEPAVETGTGTESEN